jgi:RimJ/RimL family protein N-acetyltransferase
MLESMGFCKEGVLREHVVINGEYVDSILHGLILE